MEAGHLDLEFGSPGIRGSTASQAESLSLSTRYVLSTEGHPLLIDTKGVNRAKPDRMMDLKEMKKAEGV